MSIFHKKHPSITLQLRPHSFHHLEKVQPGLTVLCEKGLLLMTQSGDRQDYTIKPGERVTLNSKGHVLIEAVSEANLCILYPN